MMDQIQKGIAALAAMDRLKEQIGMQLTLDQQMGISTALTNDPHSFNKFVMSDAGRVALRALTEEFLRHSGVSAVTTKE